MMQLNFQTVRLCCSRTSRLDSTQQSYSFLSQLLPRLGKSLSVKPQISDQGELACAQSRGRRNKPTFLAGFLHQASSQPFDHSIDAFRRGLQEEGFRWGMVNTTGCRRWRRIWFAQPRQCYSSSIDAEDRLGAALGQGLADRVPARRNLCDAS